MKIATIVLSLIATQAVADVQGVWQTERTDEGTFAHVTMAPCGSMVCGTITRTYDKEGVSGPSPILGKKIVWDMRSSSANKWKNGKIWAPDTDKTYKSKMSLKGDVLKVSGCVLGGVICRSQDWMRVK